MLIEINESRNLLSLAIVPFDGKRRPSSMRSNRSKHKDISRNRYTPRPRSIPPQWRLLLEIDRCPPEKTAPRKKTEIIAWSWRIALSQ